MKIDCLLIFLSFERNLSVNYFVKIMLAKPLYCNLLRLSIITFLWFHFSTNRLFFKSLANRSYGFVSFDYLVGKKVFKNHNFRTVIKSGYRNFKAEFSKP